MPNPIHVTAAQARRLERNLSGKVGKREDQRSRDPAETIRRLRAENAALRGMIAKLEQEIAELQEEKVH